MRLIRRLAPLLVLSACSPQPLPAPVKEPVAVEPPAPPPAPVAVEVPAPPPAPPPAEPPPPEPEVGPTLQADRFLAAGAGLLFPKRGFLTHDGPASFTFGGPAIDGGHARPLQHGQRVPVLVVEEHPRSLRVVVADRKIRLAVFVPRTAMARLSARATWLSRAPSIEPDTSAGARVAPGVTLVEEAHQGSRVHVAGEIARARFEGWIPDDALGEVYEPERAPPPSRGAAVAEGTVVTTPTGEVIARLGSPPVPGAPRFAFEVDPLPGAPAGFQRIRLRLEQLEVVGLVPLASYRAGPNARDAFSLSGFGDGGGAISDTQVATLRKGASIFDARGALVGVVLADSEAWLGSAPIVNDNSTRAAQIYIHPLGFFDARMRSADLRPR